MQRIAILFLLLTAFIFGQSKYFLPIKIEQSNGRPINAANVDLYTAGTSTKVYDLTYLDNSSGSYYTTSSIGTGFYDIYVNGRSWRTGIYINTSAQDVTLVQDSTRWRLYSGAADTTAMKAITSNTKTGGIVHLEKLSSADPENTTGGGIFVMVDSTYSQDGYNYFNTGYGTQWVRWTALPFITHFTVANRPTPSVDGSFVYNSTDTTLEFRSGAKWREVSLSPDRKINIIAIGNSIVLGTGGKGDTTSWVDYFNRRSKREGYGINLSKFATGGQAISQIVSQYTDSASTAMKDTTNAVFFFAGTNDMNASADIEDMKSDVDALIDSIKADGKQVITAALMYNSTWDASDYSKARFYNSYLRNHKKVDYFIESWRGTLGDSASGADTFYTAYHSSGSHPNDNGYILMSDLIDATRLRDLHNSVFPIDNSSIINRKGKLVATGKIDTILTFTETKTDDSPNGAYREYVDAKGKVVLKYAQVWDAVSSVWTTVDTLVTTIGSPRNRPLPTPPIAGYTIWCVGDSVTTVNDSVSVWKDLASDSTINQTTQTNRPLWIDGTETNSANGWACLYFDHTDDYLNVAFSNSSNNHAFFAVVRTDSSVDDNDDYIFDAQTGRFAFGLHGGTVNYSGNYDGVWDQGLNTNINSWHVLSGVYKGSAGNSVVWSNDDILISALGATERVIGGNVAIGARYDGAFHFLGGWLAEFIYYPLPFTVAQDDSVRNYLYDKYGIKP